MSKICPKCSQEYENKMEYCTECGCKLSQAKKIPPILFCPKCGGKLRKGAIYCEKCGSQIEKINSKQEVKVENSDENYKKYYPILIGLIINSIIGLVSQNIYPVIIGALILGYLSINNNLVDLLIYSLILSILSLVIIDYNLLMNFLSSMPATMYFIYLQFLTDLAYSVVLSIVFSFIGFKLKEIFPELHNKIINMGA